MNVELEAHRRATFLREIIFKEEFVITRIESDDQHADVLTKPLVYTAFCDHRDFLMMNV